MAAEDTEEVDTSGEAAISVVEGVTSAVAVGTSEGADTSVDATAAVSLAAHFAEARASAAAGFEVTPSAAATVRSVMDEASQAAIAGAAAASIGVTTIAADIPSSSAAVTTTTTITTTDITATMTIVAGFIAGPWRRGAPIGGADIARACIERLSLI